MGKLFCKHLNFFLSISIAGMSKHLDMKNKSKITAKYIT